MADVASGTLRYVALISLGVSAQGGRSGEPTPADLYERFLAGVG
jgi:hypothetical protein